MDIKYRILENGLPVVLCSDDGRGQITDNPKTEPKILKITYWCDGGYPKDVNKNWYVPDARCFLFSEDSGMRRCIEADDELHQAFVDHFEQRLAAVPWCEIL